MYLGKTNRFLVTLMTSCGLYIRFWGGILGGMHNMAAEILVDFREFRGCFPLTLFDLREAA
jgi:hypothetical protein